ncbi:MAG: hypothetical protein BWX90_00211 [bacterium ADurb.Bin132]|nr:MAG: hypothetical protein BWX90_00211 [bacterium ADurb.Bin132]
MGNQAIKLRTKSGTLCRIGDAVFVRAKPNLAGKLVKLGGGADEPCRTADEGHKLRVFFGETRDWELINIEHIYICCYFLPQEIIYCK